MCVVDTHLLCSPSVGVADGRIQGPNKASDASQQSLTPVSIREKEDNHQKEFQLNELLKDYNLVYVESAYLLYSGKFSFDYL